MKRKVQLRIRMTEEEMAALNANSTPGKRSEFIREAIKAAIKRQKRRIMPSFSRLQEIGKLSDYELETK